MERRRYPHGRKKNRTDRNIVHGQESQQSTSNLSVPSSSGATYREHGSNDSVNYSHRKERDTLKRNRPGAQAQKRGNDGQTKNQLQKEYKKHGKRRRWRHPKQVESQPSSSDSDQVTDQYEIPGFYYDREKKRYFRILENSSIPMAVTKSSIAKKEAEEKRLKDIKNLECKKFKKFDEHTSDLVNMIFSSRQGDMAQNKFRTGLLRNHASNLKLTDSFKVFPNPSHGHECVEHMLKMILSPNCDKLLCLWTVKETIVQRLQMVQVMERRRTNESHTLSIELGKTNVVHSWHKITNVCWAPFQKYPERRTVLYTTNCHHTGQALVYIRNLDVAVRDDIALFDFRIGSQATWTCAWNRQTEKFSVGAEKTCLLIDVATRKLWELNTLNSDPLSQAFSSCNLLYNGTRKGKILSHDLRTSSTRPVRCLSHKSSISHLQLSCNENFICASDFLGQLKVWDIRKNEVVMEYKGLYNEYKRIPFHIDESNTILYGAGQDGYTRVWCVKSGKLLTSLPPPCSISLDTIPAVQFSTRWANRSGNSGLLMGLGDRMYLYSNYID